MMTFESLSAHPRAFLSLSGLSLADFEALYQDFAVAYAQDRQTCLTRKKRQPRRRAAGAGAKFSQDGRTRLLMALVWLRVYPTYEVLGFFFSLNIFLLHIFLLHIFLLNIFLLHKANAQRGVADVLDTLAAHTVFVCERPAKERQKLRSVQAVMDAFPDVRLVIDAKEQRVQRPGGSDEKGDSRQKPFYSGKKKAHTLKPIILKTQVSVAPDGQFQSVSDSVPGSVHDLTLLRRSGLRHRLNKTEATMMDKGYDGITTLDPKQPDRNGPPRPCYLPHKARRGHPLTDEQKAYNAHLSRYRIIVEHSLAQMNQFQSLAQVYRHRREGHKIVTRVVAGLVNRRITQRPLRTYPAACAAA